MLRDYITELYCGIILQNYITGISDRILTFGPNNHSRPQKQPYLALSTTPEALDCFIRIVSLQRIIPRKPSDRYILYTTRSEPFWCPAPGLRTGFTLTGIYLLQTYAKGFHHWIILQNYIAKSYHRITLRNHLTESCMSDLTIMVLIRNSGVEQVLTACFMICSDLLRVWTSWGL